MKIDITDCNANSRKQSLILAVGVRKWPLVNYCAKLTSFLTIQSILLEQSVVLFFILEEHHHKISFHNDLRSRTLCKSL